MLVQTEPGDLSGLAKVRDALLGIADGDETKKALVSAADTIDKIVKNEAKDPAAALAEAGRLVDEASSGKPPEPARETLLPPDSDRELISEFITESREYIAAAERALL